MPTSFSIRGREKHERNRALVDMADIVRCFQLVNIDALRCFWTLRSHRRTNSRTEMH